MNVRVFILLLCWCVLSAQAMHEEQKKTDDALIARLCAVLPFIKAKAITPAFLAKILGSLRAQQQASARKDAPLTDFTQKRSRASCPGCPGVDEW